MPAHYQDFDDDPPTVELPAIDIHGPAAPVSEVSRTTCGQCRAESRTHDQFCPQCAARYWSSTSSRRPWRTVALAILIIAGLIAAAVIIAAYNNEPAARALGQSAQAHAVQTALMRLPG